MNLKKEASFPEGAGVMPKTPLSCETTTWMAAAVVYPLTSTSERIQLSLPRPSREKPVCQMPARRQREVTT